MDGHRGKEESWNSPPPGLTPRSDISWWSPFPADSPRGGQPLTLPPSFRCSVSWEGSLSLRRAGCSKGGGQPLWGRPREKGSLWLTNGVFSPPPQVQASEVTSEDQDNPEVFYTVERDESGEVVCLCSDMGEAYDKIGGSPLEGQQSRGHRRRSPCEQTRCPHLCHSPGPEKAGGGGWQGQPPEGLEHKGLWEEQVPVLRSAWPVRAATPPDAGAQLAPWDAQLRTLGCRQGRRAPQTPPPWQQRALPLL